MERGLFLIGLIFVVIGVPLGLIETADHGPTGFVSLMVVVGIGLFLMGLSEIIRLLKRLVVSKESQSSGI